MAPFTQTLAAATLAGLASMAAAVPTRIGAASLAGEDGTASLMQVRNENYKFNGAVSIYKTYLKFGKPIPDYLQAAVDRTGLVKKRSQGSSVATPVDSYDDAYTIPVSIGTPPQVLQLDLDTGSSDMWVFSSETDTSEVNGQTLYYPSKSSTAKLEDGSSWSINYGSVDDPSSSSGIVYSDTVTIAGITVNQDVEVAQKVSSAFTNDSAVDGLLGLGFDTLNSVYPDAVPTFFDNAKSSLSKPLFTADLKHEAPGTYNFGYIDSSLYTGSISYVNVDTYPGYWRFTSSGYSIGSTTFKTTALVGIADTGTTLLYLPLSIVEAYYAKVSGAADNSNYGGYVFSCSATLPTFTFGVGSLKITIPAKYMNYGPVDTEGTTCFGGLQDSSDLGINIFGDVALKSAFVVFNGATVPTIGWAAKTLN
ncbi:aspartic proteinase [Grosmannia clavigera kw1407]|uniref:Aspartic proteinase n=1 Tax=Grosmannia clavigera (strain kw1407 / UAMH 11150) TaxID=655863 RepID=F0XKE1_GROCL|nr:aspartic proteinase [Grosmannia clavigera kw1407]EFX01969.1 aspartic proteinase [Grosmannia clavigera kw1407]